MKEAGRGTRRAIAVAFAGLLLAPIAIATDGTVPRCSEGEFQRVADLGSVCRTGAGYEVKLADGSTVYTHGGDPGYAFEPTTTEGPVSDNPLGIPNQVTPGSGVGPWGPYCVRDTDAPRFVVIDGRTLYSQDDDDDREIREDLLEATRTFIREADKFDAYRSYRVECNDEGRVAIHDVQVDTPVWETSFTSIVNDLQDQGFDEPDEKYLVFFDQRFTDWAGIATMTHDDSPGASNLNNQGPDYSVISPWADPDTVVHELGHNMGAVQTSAPHYYLNSGGDHCWDEIDIMCYGDETEVLCPRDEHFDCGHDDFFHPDPPEGNYLADHWNIGDPVNRFLQSAETSQAPQTPQDLTALAGPGLDEVTLLWNPPEDPGASEVEAYRIYASEDSNLLDDVRLAAYPSYTEVAYPVVFDGEGLRSDSVYEIDAITGDYAFSHTMDGLGISQNQSSEARSLATFRVSAINTHAESAMSPPVAMVAAPGP